MRDNLHSGPRIISGAADALVLKPEPWMEKVLCAQVDPELFFPEKGGSTKEAKSVCAKCEVVEQCLEYALKNDERFGVLGGKSERERRAMKPRECRECGDAFVGNRSARYCSPECTQIGTRRMRLQASRRRQAKVI